MTDYTTKQLGIIWANIGRAEQWAASVPQAKRVELVQRIQAKRIDFYTREAGAERKARVLRILQNA